MWIKTDWLCTSCDTLTEITSTLALLDEPTCSCDNPQIIRINKQYVTEPTSI